MIGEFSHEDLYDMNGYDLADSLLDVKAELECYIFAYNWSPEDRKESIEEGIEAKLGRASILEDIAQIYLEVDAQDNDRAQNIKDFYSIMDTVGETGTISARPEVVLQTSEDPRVKLKSAVQAYSEIEKVLDQHERLDFDLLEQQ